MELKLIQNKIYEVRGVKVMLDFDLAALYGTETKVLKQSIKRNIKRFPSDFMFELTQEEFERLRSHFVTSNKRGGTRYLPFAFSELGKLKKNIRMIENKHSDDRKQTSGSLQTIIRMFFIP